MEEIAQKTELSKGAIYLYFRSKEEIYVSLMNEGAGILHNMLKDAVSAELPADTLLRRLGDAYLRFYRDYPGYFRMLFLYSVSPEFAEKISPDLSERCEDQAKDSLMLVSHVIQKGIDEKIFKPRNPWDFAILLWTCQNGVILLGERGDDQFLKLNTSIQKLHDLFVESMIVALKTGR